MGLLPGLLRPGSKRRLLTFRNPNSILPRFLFREALENAVANTPQASKRARQAEARRQRNASARSTVRTAIKKVSNAISEGDKEASEAAYKAAVPVIDRTVRKGLIRRNKAARHKRRLNAHIRA